MTVYKPTYDGQSISADKPSFRFMASGDKVVTASNPITGDAAHTIIVTYKADSVASPTYPRRLVAIGTWGTNTVSDIYIDLTGYPVFGVETAKKYTHTKLIDTSWHTYASVYDLSSIKGYIDGSLAGSTAISGINLGAGTICVGTDSSGFTNTALGSISRALVFNYAITDEAKIRRYSAGAKLDYEDIGGSMTDKSLGLSWLNYSFNAFTPSGKAITSYTISATNQFGYLGSFPIVIGKKYRVTYSGFTGASSSVRLQFASGVFAGESDAQYLTSSAGYVDLTATVSDPSAVLLIQAGVSSGTGALTLVSIIQLGAVVDLEPENITDTTWFDTSGLHGVVSGALASRATPNYSSKNWLINGGFDFWQRNTSFSSSGYTADRFWIQFVSDTPTVSRVSDTSFGTPYALSIATTTGTTTGSVLRSPIESVTVRQMAGKFFTLSCYVKRNAGFNAGNIAFGVEWGTGNNEANPSGGYNLTKEVPYDFLNASTYVFVSHTFYVPATATSMSTFLGFYASSVNGTPPSGSQVIFKNMMLNEGPVAAPFERAGGSIGGELALCQRYYERSYDIDVATGAQNANGNVSCRVTSSGNTTTVSGSTFRVTKFKIPTVTIWSGSNSTPTSGKISLDGGSDAAGTAAASGIGTNGFIRVQGNTSLSDANTYLYGWTADAEI